jgi:hypothetical protein
MAESRSDNAGYIFCAQGGGRMERVLRMLVLSTVGRRLDQNICPSTRMLFREHVAVGHGEVPKIIPHH